MSILARCVVAVLACSSVLDARAQRGDVNVVCSVPLNWCEAAATAFSRETGVKVHLTQKASADALSQVEFERGSPRHDVWFGGTRAAHLRAAELTLTAEYRSPLLSELHDWATRVASESSFHSVGIYTAALGIAYNGRALERKRLPAPSCWADLGRPEYRGELRVPDPHRSEAGYATLVTLVEAFGEDGAFELLRAIDRNVTTYAHTHAGAMRAAARGEAVIAVAYLHDALIEVADGFPIRFAVPCEGAGYDIAAMSIIDGAPNAANARKFYDWALTPKAQEIGIDTRNFETPANRATPVPPFAGEQPAIRFAPHDFTARDAMAERMRLLARWSRDVHPATH